MTTDRPTLGAEYHRATKYTRESVGGRDLDFATRPSPYKHVPTQFPRVGLPEPRLEGGAGLWTAISRRRSVRHYVHEPLEPAELGQILWATSGITHASPGYDFRSAPSAGALYPIETYVVANRVKGIDAGVYHYDPREHRLALLAPGEYGEPLAGAALGQRMCASAGAVVAWTAVAGRSEWKYGDRAHRYVYMDAGHLGAQFYLAAEALGLGACTIGAFYDDEVNEVLGVDGLEETVVYMGALGRKR